MSLNTASSLRSPLIAREYFDPTNPAHLESLDVYLKTGNWGAVQFYAELPFVEVPVTVLTKFAMYERGVRAETQTERAGRLATKTLVKEPAPETKIQRRKRLADASAMVTRGVHALIEAENSRHREEAEDAEQTA